MLTSTYIQVVLDDHAKWLHGEGGKRADLSEANLCRVNLSGADLCRADLSRANLSGAHLSGAHLSGAHLRWANLSGADLSGADLHECGGSWKLAHALAQLGACGEAVQWVLQTRPDASLQTLYEAAHDEWRAWLDAQGGLDRLRES